MTEYADRWWLSADGLRLHARDYAGGEGDARLPVVCIHGLTRNSADFEELAPWIAARGRRVLALDVRGRGRSTWDPDPANYQAGTYAGDVLALFAQAGIARAVFIGTSMGGLITMALATMRPDVIGAAVLNDVGPKLSPAALARIADYVGRGPAAADWAGAAGYIRSVNGLAHPNYGEADWERFARRTFEAAPAGGLRLAYDPGIAKAFADFDPQAPQPDLTPMFLALATGRPTLLVRGALSDLLQAEAAAELRKLAPSMRYAEVPQVGHAPDLSEAEARAAIAQLLTDAP
jgi:pimeloyl-ACP methyl ester carboxylesterase